MDGFMSELKKDLENKFQFLFSSDEYVLRNEKMDKDLKDYIVILEKKDIKLRFIHDRIDYFLDIGYKNDPGKWYDLYTILSFLKKKNLIIEEVRASNRISKIKKDLKEYLLLIEEYFSDDKYGIVQNECKN